MHERHRIFAERFARTGNASDAARIAGYPSEREAGHRLAHRSDVQAVVAASRSGRGGLSVRDDAFARAFAYTRNPRAAAIAAGLTPGSAHVTARLLLGRQAVRARIEALTLSGEGAKLSDELRDRLPPRARRQAAFPSAYLAESLDPGRAAVEAGYVEKTAAERGRILLRNPVVRLLIDQVRRYALANPSSAEARGLDAAYALALSPTPAAPGRERMLFALLELDEPVVASDASRSAPRRARRPDLEPDALTDDESAPETSQEPADRSDARSPRRERHSAPSEGPVPWTDTVEGYVDPFG